MNGDLCSKASPRDPCQIFCSALTCKAAVTTRWFIQSHEVWLKHSLIWQNPASQQPSEQAYRQANKQAGRQVPSKMCVQLVADPGVTLHFCEEAGEVTTWQYQAVRPAWAVAVSKAKHNSTSRATMYTHQSLNIFGLWLIPLERRAQRRPDVR